MNSSLAKPLFALFSGFLLFTVRAFLCYLDVYFADSNMRWDVVVQAVSFLRKKYISTPGFFRAYNIYVLNSSNYLQKKMTKINYILTQIQH